ncbi:pseudouridine synthase [Candidatus Rickettsiella viridis]|uniref:Pseudouridine synthase n=1 Tax=Candidatus Rickettsiella viridis TaxID=676208 RepID=A0A2Z5V5H9_9COXI|nr:23S rRNA pseudouridine(1911/1915/1917) synthase RluD [Candidatus Rickettsiella viridis]BBB15672.1 pseudouridine synthase [Candidatus Rickettsiella viridis]
MKNTTQTVNYQVIVPEHLAEKRLDQILSALFPAYSRSRLQSWIRSQQILVDQQIKRPRDKIKAGALITIAATLPEETKWEAQSIPLDIVYEDETLLVVNKPAGLVTHPAVGNPDKTLLNALLHHCPPLKQLPRAGIIHRLDKDTSGLLVIPKTLNAHTQLVKQLQARTIQRDYYAVVEGVLISGGTVNAPIGRHPKLRKKMAVNTFSGKEAVSHYRVIERFAHHTLIKVQLETGRTHQIRVHMAHIHHPLVGDKTYRGRLQLPKKAGPELISCLRQFSRQALHAEHLKLIHPLSQEVIEWQAPLPEDMIKLINCLREDKKHA